jgi:hypothetical protein
VEMGWEREEGEVVGGAHGGLIVVVWGGRKQVAAG